MNDSYFPLYPFATDPLRILSRRPTSRPGAGAPPEPPELETKGAAPDEAGGSEPAAPDASPGAREGPPQDGEGDRAQRGGGGLPPGAGPEKPRGESPLDQAAEGPSSGSTEDEDEPAPAAPSDAEVVVAWVNEHWDTIKAMAQAEQAPAQPPPSPDPEPEHAAPVEPPRVHVARGDRWNKPKMAEFLRQLAATHSVTAAARAVGMSRRSAYKLRARLKGQPFDIAWEAAFRHGYDELAHAALELALEGEEVPHFYQGEIKGTRRKRHPQLMVQLLKLRNREGAPMLGRYNASAEYWSENWDQITDRVETGSVRWDDERAALGEAELAGLDLPSESRQVDALIRRNLPDEPKKRPGG